MQSTLLRAVALVLLSTSVGLAQKTPVTRPPTRWIIGVDRSASRTPQQMLEMRQFATGVAELVEPGDDVTIIETFQAGTDMVRQWRGSLKPLRVPPTVLPSERRSLQSFRGTVRTMAGIYTDTAGQRAIKSTDLLGLLRRVADYNRSSGPKRTIVVLLSDMRQSTPALDMDGRGPIPGEAWVAKQAAAGLVPDITGACVVAVGAPVTTARDLAVRRFWLSYLGSAGARFSESQYRTFMMPSDIACP